MDWGGSQVAMDEQGGLRAGDKVCALGQVAEKTHDY